MIIISVYPGVFALPAFGGGAGCILLDNEGCSGGEERLEDCPHSGIGVHNCVHLEDAGVICGNGKALFLMHYYIYLCRTLRRIFVGHSLQIAGQYNNYILGKQVYIGRYYYNIDYNIDIIGQHYYYIDSLEKCSEVYV